MDPLSARKESRIALSAYVDACNYVRFKIGQSLKKSEAAPMTVTIDHDRPDHWAGAHEIVFRSSSGTAVILIDHERFLDPAYIDAEAVPMFSAAIEPCCCLW